MNFNRSEPMTLRTGEVTSIERIIILIVIIWLSNRQKWRFRACELSSFQKYHVRSNSNNQNKLQKNWSQLNVASYRKQNEKEHDHLAHVGSQKYYGKSSLVQWLSTQLCKFLRIAPNWDAFWNFFYLVCEATREATFLSFNR